MSSIAASEYAAFRKEHASLTLRDDAYALSAPPSSRGEATDGGPVDVMKLRFPGLRAQQGAVPSYTVVEAPQARPARTSTMARAARSTTTLWDPELTKSESQNFKTMSALRAQILRKDRGQKLPLKKKAPPPDPTKWRPTSNVISARVAIRRPDSEVVASASPYDRAHKMQREYNRLQRDKRLAGPLKPSSHTQAKKTVECKAFLNGIDGDSLDAVTRALKTRMSPAPTASVESTFRSAPRPELP